MNDYNTEQLHRLEPAYLDRFGLLEPPFASSIDDRFYFQTPELTQQLNMLTHMTQYSDMLLLVEGAEGYGKTSLLQYFVKTGKENWHVCRINANSMMDADQLLFRLAEGFGLDGLPGNSVELREMLLEKLSRLHHNDILPVTIIDDADELSQESIELVYSLAEERADDGPMLHMVLFADPRIENTLQASSIKSLSDRITHLIELQTFNAEDTAEYIHNRLNVAGYHGEELFSDKLLKKIHKQSAGVPAKINELAHIALDDDETAEPDFETADDRYGDEEQKEHKLSAFRIILFASLGTVIAAVLWQQDRINQFIEGGELKEMLTSKPDVEEYMPKNDINTPEDKPADKPEDSPFAETKEKIIQLKPEPDQDVAADPTPDKKLETVQAPVISEPKQREEPKPTEPPAISKIEPATIKANSQLTELVLHGKNFQPNAKITVSWTGNSKELEASRITVDSDSRIRLSINPGRNPDKWTVTVSVPDTGISNTVFFNTIATIAENKPAKSGDNADPHAWVMAQNKDHFSLQLLGSHSLQAIHTFINQHELKDKTRIIKTKHKGKDWFILLSGSYPSQAKANSAMKELAQTGNKNKPWVRRFAVLQKQLQQQAPANIVAKTRPKLDNLQAHEAWIWSQNPGHYTLQLLGTHNISSLKSFISQHKLRGKVVYYHTQRDGKDWFALVYGNYTDNSKAKTAADQLPSDLKKRKPWIRNFSAIHAEMDK
ncbi:MAG: SPOR domain-containing protein [Gammaproteobacteria bacterium]|nr:SPOR domain-containing protein [Gammaproteobacteria bacterium]